MRKKISVSIFVIVAIAATIMLFAGSSFAADLPYIENNTLYKSIVSDPTDLSKAKIDSDVSRVLSNNANTKQVLYLKIDSTLWLADISNGRLAKITDNASGANLSSGGKMVAFFDRSYEISLADADGNVIKKIPGHGAAPVFSQNGQYVAYEKLADESADGDAQTLFENAKGIAVYDIKSGTDTLVTDGGGSDFSPVAFTPDMKKLYFNSSRTGIASLWVVDINGSGATQLTNLDAHQPGKKQSIPILNEDAQWSSDGTVVFGTSGDDKNIWVFKFANDGSLASLNVAAGGSSAQWAKQDKTIAFRVSDNGKSKWHTLDIE